MKKYQLIVTITLLFICVSMDAQQYTLPLWKSSIPNYKQSETKESKVLETNGFLVVRDVENPDISVYLPTKNNATGEAIIICPGGGYHVLVTNWEGIDIAKALNAKGIAAIVLKYRLPSSSNHIIAHKSPLLDAQRAMRMVRFYADKWNIDNTKIGIMGFSAGGHVASTLSTHFDNGIAQAQDSIDQQSCRPDFSILMYPVITMDDKYTHKGSKSFLLGKHPSKELLDYYSNEKQVTENTPPTILIHASDDDVVLVENSLLYYQSLIKHKVSASLHIYPYGGHGFSLAIGKGHLAGWVDQVTNWVTYISAESEKKKIIKE